MVSRLHRPNLIPIFAEGFLGVGLHARVDKNGCAVRERRRNFPRRCDWWPSAWVMTGLGGEEGGLSWSPASARATIT